MSQDSFYPGTVWIHCFVGGHGKSVLCVRSAKHTVPLSSYTGQYMANNLLVLL